MLMKLLLILLQSKSTRRKARRSSKNKKNKAAPVKIKEWIPRKFHLCKYCHKKVLHFARHLKVHRDVEEVKKILNFPTKSVERKSGINRIRSEGDFNLPIEQGNISRKQLKYKGLPLTTREVKPCLGCKKFLRKRNLYKHMKICCPEQVCLDRVNQKKSDMLILEREKSDVSYLLREKVLSGMVHDQIYEVLTADKLILKYGNHLRQKYSDEPHLINNIRLKMRNAANLLTICREIDSTITSVKSLLVPKHLDTFTAAVKRITKFREGKFQIPSLANDLGRIFNGLADRALAQATELNDDDYYKIVQRWQQVYRNDYLDVIAPRSVKTLKDNKQNNLKLLLLASDLKKLRDYLNHTIERSQDALKIKVSLKVWRTLASSILLRIIVFNRRQTGKAESVKVKEYNRRYTVQKDSKVYDNLTPAEQITCSLFKRVKVNVKRGRSVSILIDNETEEAITMMLQLREEVGVSPKNPFLFGIGRESHLRGATLLRKTVKDCGAKHPKLITGTALRKHITSMITTLFLKKHELESIAEFMGHTLKMYHDFYRLPTDAHEIARMSQLLLMLEDKETTDNLRGKSIEEVVKIVGAELDQNTFTKKNNQETDPADNQATEGNQ